MDGSKSAAAVGVAEAAADLVSSFLHPIPYFFPAPAPTSLSEAAAAQVPRTASENLETRHHHAKALGWMSTLGA